MARTNPQATSVPVTEAAASGPIADKVYDAVQKRLEHENTNKK